MPVGRLLVFACKVDKIDGRKTFLNGIVCESTAEDLTSLNVNQFFEQVKSHHPVMYATSESLYITPREAYRAYLERSK